MNRIEIIEKIHSTVDQMDEKTLTTLANFADFLSQNGGVADLLAETRDAIDHNEREAARQRYDRRQKKIQGAAGLERQVLNQIEHAKKRIQEDPDLLLDLGVQETDFLIDISLNGPQLVYDSYRLGFSRGLAAASENK